jgi:cytoskeleton protein RodZ
VSAPTAQQPGHEENPRVVLFGLRLKQQREKRGITLEQISKSTKIGTRFLEALEEDQFERLPGGIFNKGFVRAYARCIGLDEEQTITDFLAATGASQPSAALDEPPVLQPPPQPKRERAASLPWGIFATVLLITAFGFAIWGFVFRATTREKEPSQIAQPQTPSTPAEPSSSTTEPAPPSATSTQPAPSATSGVAKELQYPPTASGSAGSAGRTTPTPNELSSGTSNSGTAQNPPATRGITLRIKAHDEAWLSITVDGEVTTEITLPASAEKTVRAHNDIILKTGNVGALDFEFNGRPLPHQSGEVKTLMFGSQGLRPVSKPPAPTTDPSTQ